MLNKFVKILFLVLVTVSFQSHSQIKSEFDSSISQVIKQCDQGPYGGVNPWPWKFEQPWGHELPFPWDDIQGIWSGTIDGENIVFSFEKTDFGRGDHRIRVKQLAPNTMQEIASGLGTEKNRVVKAVVTGGRDKYYRMTVRLIQEENGGEYTTHTIVTIQHMQFNDYLYLFSIEKISNTPLTHP